MLINNFLQNYKNLSIYKLVFFITLKILIHECQFIIVFQYYILYLQKAFNRNHIFSTEIINCFSIIYTIHNLKFIMLTNL